MSADTSNLLRSEAELVLEEVCSKKLLRVTGQAYHMIGKKTKGRAHKITWVSH
jgi:hypothetical protein